MTGELRIELVIHHQGDDVAMAVVAGLEGDRLLRCWLMDRDEIFTFDTAQAIPLGHKVAVRAIRAGQPVMKYGVSIGTASTDIRAGEHVHIHNLKSNHW